MDQVQERQPFKQELKKEESRKKESRKDSRNTPPHRRHRHNSNPSDGGPSGSDSDHTSRPSPKTPYTTTTSPTRTNTTNTHTTPSTSRRRSPKSPKSTDQLIKIMKQQNDAMFAICNTIKDTSATHTPHTERFKVKYSLQLKNVKLSKGERVTAAFVIKTLTAAKDIDIAANKAITRKPQTDSEWQSFFKFHLAHMTDILHEEMSIIVENHTFTDTHLFWTQVFKKIFPNEMAMDAFDKALTSYMVWNEPLGIERWEGITRNLLAHKAVMSGKTVNDIHMYMAEGMAHQLQRLVMACPESYSAPLFEKYTSVYAEILEHKDDGTPVSSVYV
jgi:hypothetical protein